MANVSHRYVEAESGDQAEALVQAALIQCLALHARPADKTLAATFERASTRQRRELLASMDGLMTPTSRAQIRREIRRLERLKKNQSDLESWVKTQPIALTPADPLLVERLVTRTEVEHLERNLTRLTRWNAKSPLHDA